MPTIQEDMMRFARRLFASVTALLLASAGPLAALQDAPVKVDVTTTESHTTWYTSPVWLAVGGLLVLLIIVAAVSAGRSGKTTTTVIR
jgi:hypothetical protein